MSKALDRIADALERQNAIGDQLVMQLSQLNLIMQASVNNAQTAMRNQQVGLQEAMEMLSGGAASSEAVPGMKVG